MSKEKSSSKSSLIQRYLKNTKSEYAYHLKDNKYPIKEWISTGNLSINTLISADPSKGIPTGRVIQFAGPASVGKTYIAQQCVLEAQKAGYQIFYFDSEGAQDYDSLVSKGIDEDMFVLIPVRTVREAQTEILTIINSIEKDDKALFVLDSAGNLGTDKEIRDAEDATGKEDMGKRAKEFKGMFRTILMPLASKNIPMIVINHEYQTMEMYGRAKQSGGTGIEYGSSVIISMTKSKEEEGSGTSKELVGTGAKCTTFKNRFAREKMQVRVVIDYNKGLSKYSGLFDLAVYSDAIVSPVQGWYCYREHIDAKDWDANGDIPKGWSQKKRKKDFGSDQSDVWDSILENGLTDKLYSHFSYQSTAEGIFDDTDYLSDELEQTDPIVGG